MFGPYKGQKIGSGPVWTGTAPDGMDTSRCGTSKPWAFGTGWYGTVGDVGQVDARWTNAGELPCGNGKALFYCFEYFETDGWISRSRRVALRPARGGRASHPCG